MKNIILVTADSLRADHCGYIGNTNLTPNLDAIGEDSLEFKSAIAPGPRTLSSVPVTNTGVHFPITEHDTNQLDQRVARIRDHLEQFDTIGEKLEDQGYTTIAFTANPWTTENNRFDKGFERFEQVGKDGETIKNLFAETPFYLPARFFDLWVHKDGWFSQWRTFYAEVKEALQEADEPYFIWIFLLDTHNPYLVPRRDRHESSTIGMYKSILKANSLFNQSGGKTAFNESVNDNTLEEIQSAYRDCIRSVDKFIGRLKREHVDDESVFIFHSDHGEAFGEHGTFGHEPELYEENIHIPLLVHNSINSGIVEEPIDMSDLPDIILSSVTGGLDVESLTRQFAVSRTEDSQQIAVRGKRWKYIYSDNEELYDLREDPNEEVECASEHPKILETLRNAKNAYMADLPAPNSRNSVAAGDDMREHLESLGYLSE